MIMLLGCFLFLVITRKGWCHMAHGYGSGGKFRGGSKKKRTERAKPAKAKKQSDKTHGTVKKKK